MKEMEGDEGARRHAFHSPFCCLFPRRRLRRGIPPISPSSLLSLDSNRRRHELMDRFVKTIDRSIGENALNDPAAV